MGLGSNSNLFISGQEIFGELVHLLCASLSHLSDGGHNSCYFIGLSENSKGVHSWLIVSVR